MEKDRGYTLYQEDDGVVFHLDRPHVPRILGRWGDATRMGSR